MPKISTWRTDPNTNSRYLPALTDVRVHSEWKYDDKYTLDLKIGVASGTVIARVQYTLSDLVEAIKVVQPDRDLRADFYFHCAASTSDPLVSEALEKKALELYVKLRQNREDYERELREESAKAEALKKAAAEIYALELSARTTEVLIANGTLTREQFMQLTPAEALRIPRMGRKGLKEITEAQAKQAAS